MTLRAGILGTGSIAHKHAQAIQELGAQVELVACYSREETRARAFAQEYTRGRAQVFTSPSALLECAPLDLVLLCLPPFAYTNQVELAAARGIHILIEKPMALDSGQAWQMVHAAERAHIKTQVGLMYRFGAAVEEYARRARSGQLGRVGLMSAYYFSNSLHAPWWRERAKSGGQLVEQAIHLFDLVRYLVGEPARVYSRQANLFHQHVPGYDIDDVSATVVECANGALGVVAATNAAIPNQWRKGWQVISENALAEFADWNHATFTPTDAPGRAPETIASERNVFVAQLQDLLNAIQHGGETRTPLREGARSLDFVLAAVRSNATGLAVSL